MNGASAIDARVGVPEKTGAREAGEDFRGRGSSVASRARSAAFFPALPLF